MRKPFWLVVLLLAGVSIASSCLYTVDRTEFVYLTQFGAHRRTFDGARDGDAGLHVKWPWPIESVQRLDRRLQYFDLPGAELTTCDRDLNTIDKTLTIDAYVCWRIADGDDVGKHVDKFVRTVGTAEGARALLSQRLSSELGALVADMEMKELVSTQLVPGEERRPTVDARREKLRDDLLRQVKQSREEYGIDVVEVRLRRMNHPNSVRDEIFTRIRSDREKMAAHYTSVGDKEAANIRSASVKRITSLETRAKATAVRRRGQADAEADRIRGQAQQQDPEFYAFLKKLEAYKSMFGDNKTTLLLSTKRDLFDLFNNPPGMKAPAKGPGEK
jgi:membrane protease subunit HflC